ncbi:hypothetical protein BKI52_34680 [marine bacterium AO1-C]|nr:hypothetical protein BKI52_34680 [marine bacterium AO1-C]
MKIRRKKVLVGLFNISLAGVGFLLILLFFFNYLFSPTKVRHQVKMPNLLGSKVDTLQQFLSKYNLKYRITHEIDNWKLKKTAGTILTQIPKSGKEIKEGREVLIGVMAKKITDQVKMPKLIDKELDIAVAELRSLNLDTGKITYRAYKNNHAVMTQSYQGRLIKPGEFISKGSKIELLVGIRTNSKWFKMPDLEGLQLTEAKKRIDEAQLWLRNITYIERPGKKPGTVVRQKPTTRTYPDMDKVRAGEIVDLWVVSNKK